MNDLNQKNIENFVSRRIAGFSLMEIMFALIIVGILSATAFVSYQRLVSKAKQMEAKTVLAAIYKGQQFYYMDQREFSNELIKLDIQIPKKSLYSYTITLDSTKQNFVATAKANLDVDLIEDEWNINQDNELKHLTNDILE